METTNEFILIQSTVPHIAEKLKLFWGSDYFSEYVNILILDTRDGKRNGFREDVMKSILFLLKEHNEKYPVVQKTNVWDTYHKW